jgi:hypothetical protein
MIYLDIVLVLCNDVVVGPAEEVSTVGIFRPTNAKGRFLTLLKAKEASPAEKDVPHAWEGNLQFSGEAD